MVESFDVFYGLVAQGRERRVVVYDGHDCRSACAPEVPVPIVARWVRQKCRNQDCSLLGQDRVIVPYCRLGEGCLCSALQATEAEQKT